MEASVVFIRGMLTSCKIIIKQPMVSLFIKFKQFWAALSYFHYIWAVLFEFCTSLIIFFFNNFDYLLISCFRNRGIQNIYLSYLEMHQQKGLKIYTYIPYDSEQSFDKVESSNSRTGTAPGTILPQKEQSSFEWNSIQASDANKGDQINLCPKKIRKLLPFDCPGLWQSNCKKCQSKLNQLEAAMNVRMNSGAELKRVMPLPINQQSDDLDYVVEYENHQFEKFTSKALQKWYIAEMVYSLQQALFKQ